MKMNENCTSFILYWVTFSQYALNSNELRSKTKSRKQKFLQKTRSVKRVPLLNELIYITHFDGYIGTLFMTHSFYKIFYKKYL